MGPLRYGSAGVGRRTRPLIALLLTWLFHQPAHAWTPEELQARLTEIEEFRKLRARQGHVPSENDLRKVAGGSIVSGQLGSSSGSRAYGAAIVPFPIGYFWAALNDETRQLGYTQVTYAEVLEGRACVSGRKVLQFLPIPVFMMSPRWWIGIRYANSRLHSASGGAVRELSWTSSVDKSLVTTESGLKMIEQGEPIGFTKGAWFMVALDERSTYVEYYSHSDPGGSISSSMASMFATKGVKEAFRSITKFAQERRPSCPIK